MIIPRHFIVLCMLLAHAANCTAQDFHTYFTDQTLRLDYIFSGNKHKQHISLSNISSTPHWYGKRQRLSESPVEGNGQITVRRHNEDSIHYNRSSHYNHSQPHHSYCYSLRGRYH